MKSYLTGLIGITAFVSLRVFAQAPSVRVVAPSSAVAAQTVGVSVVVSGMPGLQGIQLLSPAFGITDVDAQAPFAFNVTFPTNTLGPQKLTAFAFTGPGEGVFSDSVTLPVLPPNALASLSTEANSIPFSFIGERTQIRVTGKFVTGESADISSLASTVFSSQNNAVAIIDSSGTVTAKGEGQTTITVRNGSASKSIIVSVPSAIRADLDGDGKVGQDDLNVLITFIGSPVTAGGDARDLNGDGKIDELDVQLLQGLCSSTCIPGGHTVPVEGILNGASFAENSLAPGAWFTLFTRGLPAPTILAESAPFPSSLAGVSVKINGIDVPLLFVSPTQINGQIPYEIAPGVATLTVTANNGSSLPIQVTIARTAPGLFQHPGGGRAIVHNQDYTVNGSENPALVGDLIVAYFTGQGSLDSPIPTGAAVPLTTLSRATSATTATIGGLAGRVEYSGMTPGYVGLAQANIVVPNLPSGDYPLIITVGGVPSNAGTVSVRAR